MRKTALLFLIAISFSACSAHKKVVHTNRPNYPSAAPVVSNTRAHDNNEKIKQQRQEPTGGFVTYTTQQYVDRFKAIAIQEMNLYGIPASITLAQGLFESGTGNGDLARYANNHFGIKCNSEWHGQSYFKDDDQVNDCFRVYNNPEESFRDHSEFLKRKRYAHLFELDKNDYQGWAQGLKDAGYATNPKYPQLIINIIQKYGLDVYDRPENEAQKVKREDRVLTEINENIGKATKDSIIGAAPVNKTYTVTTGDTLYNISRRFGLTVDDLKALNNMADNNIKIGQTLVIAR
ncbi:glucosaminidase domain-containing protein [Mucilaginibacter agri]|uniref:Peptidoglycan hydrolase n=1 Tax=Mucilaginibacter agri TaxID=2695265 RepID=A0A965ZE65_9SPHI|nr:glucosaminidase domain-containing protein [Mucilaginibacter agri]NCD69408.1 LysM peptidoglycan-binding domain-containing protein [Mucilaginibacter agri]